MSLKKTLRQILNANQLELSYGIMTDDDEKIVNLRGIAIISTFIISCILLYLQTSEWQGNNP